MIGSDSVPHLAPGVRLRHDHVRGGTMLLGPERGFALDEVASAILLLCSGERDVHEIVGLLQRKYRGPREAIERDVLGFLRTLEQRRFVLAGVTRSRS